MVDMTVAVAAVLPLLYDRVHSRSKSTEVLSVLHIQSTYHSNHHGMLGYDHWMVRTLSI
jgi:hypothetical protein